MTGFAFHSSLLAEAAVPTHDALLPLLLLVPVIGAIVVALIRDGSLARTAAIGVGLATFVLSVMLLLKLGIADASRIASGAKVLWTGPAFFSLENFSHVRWSETSAFSLSFSADAIAGWLIALTALLTPLAMLATRQGIDRARSYFAWLLLLEAACIGAFLASDILLFYIFFELTLVPAFFLIGQWGGAERRAAATKFFVYTFAGSLFMLASILMVGFRCGSFDIAACAAYMQAASSGERFWVLFGLLIGLCVKVPLLPLHTWLPITYSNAPAPITALLSGVLAKLGTYGLLRLAIPIGLLGPSTDSGSDTLFDAVVALSTLAIIYAALVAWVQRDFKLLLAYSSISHLGFCVLAMSTRSTLGGQAAVLYMINHGISTAALFFMLGMIENRVGTRSMEQVSGLGRERPKLAFFFVLFVMSAIGLPLTNGFVSEFLAIQSTLAAVPQRMSLWVTVLAASGVVLGAIYMLHLTAKLIFGPAKQPASVTGTISDLSGREMTVLVPLAVLVLALGVQPNYVLESIRAPVAQINATTPTQAVTASVDVNADLPASN